jgi:hypothetical protein
LRLTALLLLKFVADDGFAAVATLNDVETRPTNNAPAAITMEGFMVANPGEIARGGDGRLRGWSIMAQTFERGKGAGVKV